MANPNAAQAKMKVGRDLLSQMAGRMLLQGSNGFARFVTWVSLIGLVLGVGVLTLVVNVMNGFDHELRAAVIRQYSPHFDSSAVAISAFAAGVGGAF